MSEKNLISFHRHRSPALNIQPIEWHSKDQEDRNTFSNPDSGNVNGGRKSEARSLASYRIPCAGAFIVVASLLTGCAGSSFTGSSMLPRHLFSADRSSKHNLLKSESYKIAHHSETTRSGSILIARPAPRVNVMYAAADSSRLSGSEPRILGFAPTLTDDKGLISQSPVATINRSAATVAVSGLDEPGVVRQISESIPSGPYKVGLIQRNPRWYAPDSYYTRRNLKVPPAGSAPRFLKGALGIGAIFLQPLNALNSLLQIPLHCAKEYTEDVGGVQLPEDTYLELQRALKLGNTVVIE